MPNNPYDRIPGQYERVPPGLGDPYGVKAGYATLPNVSPYAVMPSVRRNPISRAVQEDFGLNNGYAQIPAILKTPTIKENPYGAFYIPSTPKFDVPAKGEPTQYARIPARPPVTIKVTPAMRAEPSAPNRDQATPFKVEQKNQYRDIRDAIARPVYDDPKKAVEVKNPQGLFEDKIKKFNIEVAGAKDKNAPKEVVKQLRETFNSLLKEASSFRGQLKGNQVSLVLQLAGNQIQALEKKHQIEKPKVVIRAPEGMAPPLPPRPKR